MVFLCLLLFLLLAAVSVYAIQLHLQKTLSDEQGKRLLEQVQQLGAQQNQTTAQLSNARGQVTNLELRLAPYESLDREKAKALAEVQAERQRWTEDVARLSAERQQLLAQLRTINQSIRSQKAELGELETALDLHHFGFYQSHYEFATSAAYEARLTQVRELQKRVLTDKRAVVQSSELEINGSKAEGRKYAQQIIRLVLRAFNGESDSAIARARYNNAVAMEQRIRKAFDAINSYTQSQQIHITPEYLDLKIQEFRLAHEYQEKLQIEKEEQRRIREEMREEEAARRDAERRQSEAEREERQAAQALQKARREMASMVGEQQRRMQEHIAELERQLQEKSDLKQRAIAQAQLTKLGHVYVISNIGSFGEDVYKIGMTRRFIPQDRVDELGDASVPFTFDVHAIIKSDDAPALEAKLHREFNNRRVNMKNTRKEFFRVSLPEIAQAVKAHHGEFEFVYDAEARDYYETLAILDARKNGQVHH